MTVSSSDSTARNPPSNTLRCRSHSISTPSAAHPDSATAVAVHRTRTTESAARAVVGAAPAADGESATNGPDPRPRRNAPAAAMRLIAAAINCVASNPNAGTKAKSVKNAPAAAPSVLMP